MCGITGYWAYRSTNVGANTFRAFTHSLSHRGPDGFGIERLDTGRLWLGHRRLAILDLSERGHQPMSYANGRYWLTFNGEVYNFLELRQTLEDLGHHFRSDTDSEVILAAYAEWGANCQLRFNGMWAFGIWDALERRLFLSRDRFGIKPLHYRAIIGSISFASELKSFLTLPGVDGGFNDEILAETLTNINGLESTPYTLLPSVNRLQAGHCMEISANGEIKIHQWWDTLAHLPDPDQKFSEQVSEFQNLFFDSCRIRLRSDVSIATSLSGGLDSSSVACTIAELGRKGGMEHIPQDWQRAFVACFPETKLDEREYARKVVDFAGLTPVYKTIDDREALPRLEKIIFDLEGIYWVPLVGPWEIYRTMRENGIRVSLDGHGADELLGGYHFFVERALDGLMTGEIDLRRYFDLKMVLRGLTGGSGKVTRLGVKGELRWLLKRELVRFKLLYPAGRLYNRILSLYRKLAIWEPKNNNTVFLPPEPILRPFIGTKELYYENSDYRTVAMSPLQGMLYTWFHGSVLPTILRSYDRASMSHGIEVRMPFLDWRLVTYGFCLADDRKIGGGYTKRILRDAMKGLMPDSIRLRTNKIGFTTPLDDWMRGDLKEWVLDQCSNQSFLDSHIWDGRAARTLVERSVAGQGSIDPVWPILNAYVLQQLFHKEASSKYEASRKTES